MLLAVDVGNTHVVVGVFDGETLVTDFRLHTDDRLTSDEFGLTMVDLLERRDILPSSISGVVMSSVVPTLARTLEGMAQTYFKHEAMMIGPGVRTGVRIHMDDPRQAGADRIANTVAARHLYGTPAIIVDFGTATTFDAIAQSGDYLGGAIAPGIQVSHDALVRHAARLSRVELVAPPEAIGHSTTTSMQSGIVFGYVGLVEGLVARIRSELGGAATVVATGGEAAQMAPLIGVIDVIDQRLTLTGLRLIHEMNR